MGRKNEPVTALKVVLCNERYHDYDMEAAAEKALEIDVAR